MNPAPISGELGSVVPWAGAIILRGASGSVRSFRRAVAVWVAVTTATGGPTWLPGKPTRFPGISAVPLASGRRLLQVVWIISLFHFLAIFGV